MDDDGPNCEKEDWINRLPDEILEQILSRLTPTELIHGPAGACRNLNRLCQQDDEEVDFIGRDWPNCNYREKKTFCLGLSLGLYPKLRVLKAIVIDRKIDMASRALERCPVLERLEVDGGNAQADIGDLYTDLWKEGVTVVLRRFSLRSEYVDYTSPVRDKMTHLELHNCNVIGFNWLREYGCRLEVLSLTDCTSRGEGGGPFGKVVLGHKVIEYISGTVREIHLPWISLNDQTFRWVWQCPHLEKLTVQFASCEQRRCIPAWMTKQKLKYLKLRLSGGDDADLVLDAVAGTCPALTAVSLILCKKATDNGIKSIIKRCAELERMEISGSVNITKDAFCDVRAFLPKLEEIRLENCSQFSGEAGKIFAAQMADLGIRTEVLNPSSAYWSSHLLFNCGL